MRPSLFQPGESVLHGRPLPPELPSEPFLPHETDPDQPPQPKEPAPFEPGPPDAEPSMPVPSRT